MKKLLDPPNSSNVSAILQAWKLLLIAFMAGGLLGLACYGLFPPKYRAAAIVVINPNLEKVFPDSPDKEIFYFLERETNRLEELAFSDVVLERVLYELDGVSLQHLRKNLLQLSQPSDGGWRLYGIANEPEQARKLANLWADSFTKEVHKGVQNALELKTAQAQLAALTAEGSSADNSKIVKLTGKINLLQKTSYGLHAEAEVFRSQEKGLIVERVSSIGIYALAGAMAGLVGMILFGALFIKKNV